MQRPRTNVPWLGQDDSFPPVATALPESSGLGGLLAAGGDLSPSRLLAAYRAGVFPWYSQRQPILWWSPDPRMVLHTDEVRITRSLSKTLRRCANMGDWTIRFDHAFDAVIRGCQEASREGQSGTWITDDVAAGYRALFDLGFAHSFESWYDGKLVGGGYGVCIGRMFYGESMFTRATDASKVAFIGLVRWLSDAGYPLIDCQQNTRHLASFGAREISRSEFCDRVKALTQASGPAQWPSVFAMDDVANYASQRRTSSKAPGLSSA